MLRMNQYRRPAIGLVELMVAMALTIGIMWILAEAFKTGLDMTRELKSTTAMVNHLDGARAIMTYDLSKDHFPRDDSRARRRRQAEPSALRLAHHREPERVVAAQGRVLPHPEPRAHSSRRSIRMGSR